MARQFGKTTVANLASKALGESSRITDLDTHESSSADIFRLFYPFALESALMMYHWSFAVDFTDELEVVEEYPRSGYAYAYAVPDDYVVARQISWPRAFSRSMTLAPEDEIPFQEFTVAGRKQIHTDLENAAMAYTTDAGGEDALYPQSFIKLFASVLADVSGAAIVTNNFSAIQKKLEINIQKAKNTAIAEDVLRKSREPIPQSVFITERDKGLVEYSEYDSW